MKTFILMMLFAVPAVAEETKAQCRSRAIAFLDVCNGGCAGNSEEKVCREECTRMFREILTDECKVPVKR